MMRRVLCTAIFSAVLVASCTDTPAAPRLGGLSLHTYAVTAVSTDGSPLPSHTGPVDSARIVLTGPTPMTVSVTPPAEVTIDGLEPGSYTAELQAFAGDELAHQGTVTGIQVTAGTETSVAEALIAPTRLTFGSLGQTLQLDGPAGVAWSSSDEGIVSVDASGLVQALKNGQAEITGTLGSATAQIQTDIAQVVAEVTFTVQPGLTAPNRVIRPDVTVELRDAFGVLVEVLTPVTIAIGDNPGRGTLAGTTTLQAVGGVATFSDLSIDMPGLDYTLTASTDAVGGVASDAFEVNDRARDGDVAIYKDYDAWSGDARVEVGLQAAPFNLVLDSDLFVLPVVELQKEIPAATSLIFITSASIGNSPVLAMNDPAAVANVDAWVRAGGWLVVHAGDNVFGDGYIVPGLTDKVSDANECTGATLAFTEHPLVRGPDAAAGTADDLNDTNIDQTGGCADNHGSLNGLLPPDALVLLTATTSGFPTYATYRYGDGRVIVTTLTIELIALGRDQLFLNHLSWPMFGDLAIPEAPLPVAAPQLASQGPATLSWSSSTRPPGS